MAKATILSFSEISQKDISRAGGKAASLGEAIQAGFQTPGGFVLTLDFFKPWLDKIEKSAAFKRLLKASPGEIKKQCTALKKSCTLLKLSALQKKELNKALEKLSGTVFAVRSSSPQEDLKSASFAGIYETTLGVSPKNLETAILKSFTSLFDERIIQYKIQHQFPLKSPRIAVIVQEQLASEVSGVAFSLNPQNNCYDEAVITANFGLGETVVSGQVEPDTFIIEKVKKEILKKSIGQKPHALWLKKDGGTIKKKTPDAKAPALSDQQIFEITELVSRVEKHYGRPMDIEWAYADKSLYLLQARPITAYHPLFPEMITEPGQPKNLYMDLILLTQGFDESLSQLGLDIWGRMLDTVKRGTLPVGKDGIAWNVCGREYYNISNMMKAFGSKSMGRFLGLYDTPTKKALEGVDFSEYMPKEKSASLKKIPGAFIKQIGKILPVAIKGLLLRKDAIELYRKKSEEIMQKCRKELQKEKNFGELVTTGIDAFGNIASYAGGLASAMIAQWRISSMFKKENVKDLIISLKMDLPGNPTSEMGHMMVKLASSPEVQKTKTAAEFIKKIKARKYSDEFLELYEAYMQKYGCRGIKEIDIATPRTHEDIPGFFKRLQAIDINDNAIKTVKERSQRAYQKLLEVAEKIGKKEKFEKYAKVHHEMMGYREHPKYIYIVVVDLLRQRALEIGETFVKQKRLKNREQIFDLNIDQLSLAQKDSSLQLLPLIEKNLAPRKAVAHIQNWPKIIDSRGKIFRATRTSNEGLVGDPIAPGIAQGKVKTLREPYEKPLKKGEILVAKMTEPSWTPIFINAAAVILEIGGPLQHGAIIAREYGIPCVSGIENATSLLQDGQMIEVNGTTGVVKEL